MSSILSRILKLPSDHVAISNPKKEVRLASIVAMIMLAATCLMECFRYTVYRPLLQLDKRPPFAMDHFDVLFTGFFYAVLLLPLWIAMKKSGQTRESLGVSKRNLRQMFAFGLLLSGVYFSGAAFFAQDFGGNFEAFSGSLLYGLVVYAIVGFGEEVVWRGYIQTRFVAYSGTVKGVLITSFLFALLHFPLRYYQHAGVASEALASTLLVFPAGLLFGYVMLKTQNVIPCTIFHLFGNWSALFWGIPPF